MKHRIKWFALPLSLLIVFGPAVMQAEASGEKVFKKRCSQCHALPSPEKLTSEEWVLRLNSMAPMAGLRKKQKIEVLDYLQSHSKKASTLVSMSREKQLFEKRCTLCHTTNRVFLMPLTKESRRHIVLRMQARVPDWITPQEAQDILTYLDKGAPGTSKPKKKIVTGGPQEIFRQRCSACHKLDRIFYEFEEHRFKAGGWMHLVKRMREKAPNWMTEKEAKQIAKYLDTLKPAAKK